MRGYDRGYDYGLRGFPQAAQWREPVRTRFAGGGYGGDYRGPRGGYGGDYRVARTSYDSGYGAVPYPNRVTARYNLDYVREQHPGERPVNPAPYGGDRVGRIGDMYEYHRPYQTTGGTRTMRGSWPMGWERQRNRYGADFPRPRGDIGRWF